MRWLAVPVFCSCLSFVVPAQAAAHLHVAATELHDFSDGLALVVVGGKYGFIDAEGKPAIKPTFDYAEDFHDALALIRQAGKYGFIDRSGRIAIEPRFDAAAHFSEGLAPVKVGGKWGYIDHGGRLVIEASYDSAAVFAEGLAPVDLNGKSGFIDRAGKAVIQPKFNSGVLGGFHDGLARVQGGLLQVGNGAVATAECGYMDHDANVVVVPQFADCGDFADGLAPVKQAGKYGYIDRRGKIAIQPQFEEAGALSEGLARVRVAGKIGFVDRKGDWVVRPAFDEAGNFSNGLVRVKLGGEWYFIDRGGPDSAGQAAAGLPTAARHDLSPAPGLADRRARQGAGCGAPGDEGDLRYCLACGSDAAIIKCVEEGERRLKRRAGA